MLREIMEEKLKEIDRLKFLLSFQYMYTAEILSIRIMRIRATVTYSRDYKRRLINQAIIEACWHLHSLNIPL